jgi:hypothetical protein
LLLANPSGIGQATVPKVPAFQPFVVENIFTDSSGTILDRISMNASTTGQCAPSS